MLTPNPGSDEAVARGCTCGRIDNHRGQGVHVNGITQFWMREDCPLHGTKVAPETTLTQESEDNDLNPGAEWVLPAIIFAAGLAIGLWGRWILGREEKWHIERAAWMRAEANAALGRVAPHMRRASAYGGIA